MRRNKLRFLSLVIITLLSSHAYAQREKIDLSGDWYYRLHNAPIEIPGEGTLTLPGTLDTNGIGIPVPPSDNTSQLSRRVTFTGDVTYSKKITIPQSWSGKHIELMLERTRPSTLFVDGNKAGYSSRLSSPHRYDLTELLPPGEHEISIVVNNADSIPLAVRNNSHACTESTQTNWNGIIGQMTLTATNPLHIKSATSFTQPHENGTDVRVNLSRPAQEGTVIRISSENNGITSSTDEKITSDSTTFILNLPTTPGEPLWSEWNPALRNVDIELISMTGEMLDKKTIRSGIREFKATETGFTVNGNPAFMRGRHDACVFPLTAHVPMDYETWRRYFETIKQYGLNHVRFHSWCPPEACFQAADDAGVYLQPELPIWGEIDQDRTALLDFLKDDMKGIFEEYSSHPSFTFFALGNELWGDIALMKTFLDDAREINPDILMTYGSNIYLGWNGHIDGEDFLVTCRVGGADDFSTHARASFSYADADNGGIMNSSYPNSAITFTEAIGKSAVPVIGHETGQYQIYPDFREMTKYTGVLRPDNLQEFARRAKEAGTARKAGKYFKASGEWAKRLYLADMEMNLRTPGMGGFQLLDLQDYPGQGTALVGILDAFMDSKGLISPEDWRKSCDEVTVLAEFPKFCFTEGETVEVPVKVANFSGKSLANTSFRYTTPTSEGELSAPAGQGLLNAGTVTITMPAPRKPEKMQFTIASPDGAIANEYDIWVFPKELNRDENGKKNDKRRDDVLVTKDMEEALAALEEGGRVILCPDTATVSKTSLGPLFQTDYWNYRMFRSICDKIGKEPSPGTMGLLIDNNHPALSLYPTDYHTDWQWFAVLHNSNPLVIDRLPKDFDPIIEVIDNVERNYRLSLMLECNVGKGKLMILSADMDKASEYPEGKWLMTSAKEYMASKECAPLYTLTPKQIRNLLTKPSVARVIKDIRNESYDGKF